MKIIASIFLFCSFCTLACGPLVPKAATLKFFPTPIFDNNLMVTEKSGTVRGKFWIGETGKVNRFEVVEVTPKGLPLEPIIKSIENSSFVMLNLRSVKGVVIEIAFDIERNETFEFVVPKSDPIKFEPTEI